MAGVFISYRRGGSGAAAAGRLHDRLIQEFSPDDVFMDVDAIEPGVDFFSEIETALSACHALLVIIDRDWVAATDDKGARRLDNPDDFVRIEIAEGLRREIRIVPILVDGANMPRSDDLPSDIARLARHNSLVVTHERWRADIEPLLAAISRDLGVQQADVEHRRGPRASALGGGAAGGVGQRDVETGGGGQASTADAVVWNVKKLGATDQLWLEIEGSERHTLRNWSEGVTHSRGSLYLDDERVAEYSSASSRDVLEFMIRDGTGRHPAVLTIDWTFWNPKIAELQLGIGGVEQFRWTR